MPKLFFTRVLRRFLNRLALTEANRVAIACILGVYIQSFGESLMFSGVFPSIGLMLIYTSLVTYNSCEVRTKEEER